MKKREKKTKDLILDNGNKDQPLDINGNSIDPKRKYLGKKIKIPFASADCSIYKNSSTIILFGGKQKQKPEQAPKSKFEEFLSRAPISFDNEEEV